LRAQAVGDPFEDGERVVVHAAHQAVVDAVGLAGGVQRLADTVEVLERGLAQVVHQLGRGFHQALHGRVLGVQDAQRVAVQAALRLGVQQVAAGFKVA
jgi:hypothetical protein